MDSTRGPLFIGVVNMKGLHPKIKVNLFYVHTIIYELLLFIQGNAVILVISESEIQVLQTLTRRTND